MKRKTPFPESAVSPMAQRMDNAVKAFRETLQDRVSMTDAEANQIIGIYLNTKVAKMDAVMGTISVKHGAFLENDVISNALKQVRLSNKTFRQAIKDFRDRYAH